MNCARLEEELAAGGGRPRGLDSERLDHFMSCDRCRELWLSHGLAAEALATEKQDDLAGEISACASMPALAALHDGSLDDDTRSELIDHVSSCSACMSELAGQLRDLQLLSSAQLQSPPATLEASAIAVAAPRAAEPAAPRPRLWFLSLAAATGFALFAVGLGLLLYQPVWRSSSATEPSGFRGAVLGAPTLQSPRGQVSSTGALRFAWDDDGASVASSPLDGARRYRLVVIDLNSGATVIDEIVSGTSYDLSADRASDLHAGVQYHWLVEPIDGEGGAASDAVAFWRAE